MCEIQNEIGVNVCVEAGVSLQNGLKRMLSIAREVVKVFVNSNVAAVDQPKEEEMIIIYNVFQKLLFFYFSGSYGRTSENSEARF